MCVCVVTACQAIVRKQRCGSCSGVFHGATSGISLWNGRNQYLQLEHRQRDATEGEYKYRKNNKYMLLIIIKKNTDTHIILRRKFFRYVFLLCSPVCFGSLWLCVSAFFCTALFPEDMRQRSAISYSLPSLSSLSLLLLIRLIVGH